GRNWPGGASGLCRTSWMKGVPARHRNASVCRTERSGVWASRQLVESLYISPSFPNDNTVGGTAFVAGGMRRHPRRSSIVGRLTRQQRRTALCLSAHHPVGEPLLDRHAIDRRHLGLLGQLATVLDQRPQHRLVEERFRGRAKPVGVPHFTPLHW